MISLNSYSGSLSWIRYVQVINEIIPARVITSYISVKEDSNNHELVFSRDLMHEMKLKVVCVSIDSVFCGCVEMELKEFIGLRAIFVRFRIHRNAIIKLNFESVSVCGGIHP